jgi:hypothetical protein
LNLKTLSAGAPKEKGKMPVLLWEPRNRLRLSRLKPGPAFALLRFGVAGMDEDENENEDEL